MATTRSTRSAAASPAHTNTAATPATVTLALSGQVSSSAHAPTLSTGDVVLEGGIQRIEVGPAGRDASQAVVQQAVAADDLVRIEYDNGLVLWSRADDLVRERGHLHSSRGGAGGAQSTWTLDTSATPAGGQPGNGAAADRGALSLGIKALEFMGVRLSAGAARTLGKKVERSRLGRDPGLYRVSLTDGSLAPEPMPEKQTLPAGQPVLVFLHGTLSSFKGSFGSLWHNQTDEQASADDRKAAQSTLAALKDLYGTEVYAFEHRTLTESPIQNLLGLLPHLPQGARLHLVSHSRGGLLGELLSLAQCEQGHELLKADALRPLFESDGNIARQILGALKGEAAQARDAASLADLDRLMTLLQGLDDRKPRIERFVRVACPARGTTLASARLDRWLSLLGQLVPEGLAGDLTDFLLAVVKERTDPRSLPGLEAMMPGSALTRVLNLPGLRTQADLTVLAGDIEGRSFFSQVKVQVADWFFSSDHDLVVNTGSMYGGLARRPDGARFGFDQGPAVSHFNYFRNARTLHWLRDGLARPEGSQGGLRPLAPSQAQEPRARAALRASRARTEPRPLAVVIPGTMGSALKVDGEPVWLRYASIFKGELGRIEYGSSARIEPHELIDDFYGPLVEHLARTHRVEIFPYDWRQSVRNAASLLADRLESWLPEQERHGQPVHIVAHSMGGLVTRAMIADRGPGAKVWSRMKALPGSRLLMLGTPNLGSHEAVRWLTGGNPTQGKISLLDVTRSTNELIDLVRRFPGLVELLPFDESPNPWASVSTWRQLKADLGARWSTVEDKVLREASQTWKLLREESAPEPAHMIYVAGCQPSTVKQFQIVQEHGLFGMDDKRLEWFGTSQGDGTVRWASGMLPGVPTYYAPDTAHDELCANEDDVRIFRGYTDLLLKGSTDQLLRSPPSGHLRGAGPADDVLQPLPQRPLADALPDEAELRGLGFGGSLRRRPSGQKKASHLQVSVRHGDLRYARFPVMVGHYMGDTIVSAEAVLDRCLSLPDPRAPAGSETPGPLSNRRDLGLYPGPHGSHAVFFAERPDHQPQGALVVGLGQVGDLSPARLEASVRDALLHFALQSLQRHCVPGRKPDDTTERIDLKISSVLVGTGASALNVRESVEALLRAALGANARLEQARLDHRVTLQNLEIIELFEDVAIETARTLALLTRSGDLAGQIDWPRPEVEPGEGGLVRSRFDSDASWWQRIEITEDRQAERLHFVSITDRARAEETLATGQLRLADKFIEQASGSARAQPDLSKTLFEMLQPQRHKESAPDQRHKVLLLDEGSARFPWELLEDRWSRLERPQAVVSGLVRQLKASEFRATPLHASEKSIFVVGNPDLGGWDLFPDLPGARREAERVRDLFTQDGYQCHAAIDASTQTILDGLHQKAWRILHLAGHGEHDFEIAAPLALTDGAEPSGLPYSPLVPTPQPTRKISGMLIGRDTFLTPGDIEQMRHVPELVFINCCHLGKTGGGRHQYHKLAANLGVQFIRMGVRAVVCAGWVVDDAAALGFAETFYDRMLRGHTFGEAVTAARADTWSRFPGVNTWGAYQCYGDPGFRLVREGAPRISRVQPTFHAPSELVTELRNLTESTRMDAKKPGQSDERVQGRLRERLDALLARIPASGEGPEGWQARADVCAAIGFAYGEARLFEEAIEWLDRGLQATEGDCPVRAAEQCANFRVRLATQQWTRMRQTPGHQPDAPATQQQRREVVGLIETALAELRTLNSRSPSNEREALMGSACKRLAWVETGQARIDALLQMGQHYRNACEASQKADPRKADTYTFTNWAVACLLLELTAPERFGERAIGPWRHHFEHMLEPQQARQEAELAAAPHFWAATGLADLLLVQLLMARGEAATTLRLKDKATECYKAAMARGASPREVASVQDHIDFLLAVVGDAQVPTHPRKQHEALMEALNSVRSQAL